MADILDEAVGNITKIFQKAGYVSFALAKGSVCESLYGGRFTLLTLWLISYFSASLSHRPSTKFF